MPTNTAATQARDLQMQAVHYFRKKVNYNDTGIASGVKFATLPAGAMILPGACEILITTAFNAATTNNLLVGTTAGGNNLVATADSAAGATGSKAFARATVGVNGLVGATDQDLYVTYTQTGTAATAGVGYVVIAYVLNNDG